VNFNLFLIKKRVKGGIDLGGRIDNGMVNVKVNANYFFLWSCIFLLHVIGHIVVRLS
jgi:hypothetical protein